MTLESERIFLREYEQADWKRVHIYGANPEFSKYEAWGPNSEEDTKNFITDMIKNLEQEPRYKFEYAIIEKESGLLIGGCGIRRAGALSSIADFGYAVNPEFQGKGYATEATRLLMECGFKVLHLSLIYATCDSRNIASCSVMEKCNMRKVGTQKGKRKFKGSINDEFRYEILKEDYIYNINERAHSKCTTRDVT